MADMRAKQPRTDLVRSLRVAAPCSVGWDSMQGDERVRHCLQCNKNVYNISDMTESEANKFLLVTANRSCVSFYKRLDGTVITDNCPIGLRKLRAQYRKLAAAIATIVSLLQGLLLSVLAGEPAKSGSGCSSGTNTSEVQHTMGAPVPVQRLGGEPTAPVDPPAIKSYKNQVASVLAAAMPKGIDLGSAALSISIGTGGSVKSVQLISRSPSKETDEVILKVVQNLKFGNLPAEFYKHATPEGTLPVYFECRQAVAH